MLTIRLAESPQDIKACLRLRHEVFVEEQGVPVELEIDEHDRDDALHFIVLSKGEAVGAGRVVTQDNTAKIGRLVVSQQCRGEGLGRALVERILEHICALSAVDTAVLDAQTQATRFYEGLGFRTVGTEFMDAGIPHIRMIRNLD